MATAIDFWTAPRGDATADWCEHYWNSWRAPHRQIVVDLVKSVKNVRKVLEVGCHCGPNIRRLATELPNVSFVGLDCSADAVRAGREQLRVAGFRSRAALLWGTFPYTTRDWTETFDVAVTCYSMAYIPPDTLPVAITELCRLARVVVMVEPNGTDQHIERGAYAEWQHDYERTLHAVVRGRRWWHYAIDPPIQGLNAAFIVGPAAAGGDN